MKKLLAALLIASMTGCGALIDTIALPFKDKKETTEESESCGCYF